ncbi:TPA: hypothetical protein ACOVFI_004281 [Citrobacter braakii]
MKLVKTAKLFFIQGTSDKVYEVSLCEQQNEKADRYWVNFRAGRRGGTLLEGTKTPTPVDFAQAQAIFNSVVVSKINKGYSEADFHPSLSSYNSSSFPLHRQLHQIDQLKESKQRARSIWRLPQQPDVALAEWLEKGLSDQNHWLENYARLWTLGRTGGGRNLRQVKTFLTSDFQPLRNLAYEVWLRLSDREEVVAQKDRLLATLPDTFISAIETSDGAALDALLKQYITRQNPDAGTLLKTLYLLSLTSAPLHESLLRLLVDLPLCPNIFKGVRYLFKMAEFRLDASMFARLAWRFDTTPQFYWDSYLERGRFINPDTELLRADSRLAYSRKTREYLRRRSWRALRRLGVHNDTRYVDMASAVLLQYCESGLMPEKHAPAGTYASDAHLLAWNAILRMQNPHYHQRHFQRAVWIRVGNDTDEIRGEAFPHLWDQRPDALLTLLINSNSETVCNFALRALKQNTSFCQSLADPHLALLLVRPFPAIAEFVLSLLTGRPLSTTLLLAMIQSAWPQARILALTVLNNDKTLFDDTALTVGLLLVDDREIRSWLSGCFNQQPLTQERGEALAQRLHARLCVANTTFSLAHSQWLAVFITTHLNVMISQLPLEKLNVLLAHTDTGVQLLAAQLLVSSPLTLNDLPQELIARLSDSPVAAIRATVIALLGKQSAEILLRQLPPVINLLSCGESAERQECYSLLGRLAQHDAQTVFDALFPLLFQKETQEGAHRALLTFITQQLPSCLARLDKDTLWRLIQARSLAAQMLGYEILLTRSPSVFSVRQWSVLASHPDHRIRDYALRAFEQHVDIVQAHSDDALELLESDWPATREFGFAFFRQHYPSSIWTPDLIVNLCDSPREDVQAYGRELLQTFFQHDQGEAYLLKLSQHPSVTVQTFVTHFFQEYAAGKPEVILALKPCFLTILSQVNRGRIAKDRTLAFLAQQSAASPQVLEMVGELLTRLSLSVVQKDKAPLIKSMLQLQKQYPHLNLPLEFVARPVQGVRHAG